jgi:hypothetical protein
LNIDFSGYLPLKVEGHSLAQIGNYVFVIGGFNGFEVTEKIMMFDLNSGNTTL